MAGLLVGRVWGMPVRISLGLGAVLVALVLIGVQTPGLLSLVLLVAGVVLSLLVHELAHGAAARQQGYEVDAVVLTLFGGRAVWSGPEPDAHTALVIAAAGPAASAALAVACELTGHHTLAGMNVAAALVNLAPFRGLDGWVIWRALRAGPPTSSAPAP